MNRDIIEMALSQYGEFELPGHNDNPEILKYFREIGHPWVKNDETAWCSAYVNWVAKTAGYVYSGQLDARSWLNVGEETDEPWMGDVVVYWRVSPDDWRGHVGFFVRKDGNLIWTLGGNQDNKVCIKAYPDARSLGFRKLYKR